MCVRVWMWMCLHIVKHAYHPHIDRGRTVYGRECDCVRLSSIGSSYIHPLLLVCLCAVLGVGWNVWSCVCVCVLGSLMMWSQLSELSVVVVVGGHHQHWRLAWASMGRRSGCWEIPSQAWTCLFIGKWQPPVAWCTQRDNSEKCLHLSLGRRYILLPSSPLNSLSPSASSCIITITLCFSFIFFDILTINSHTFISKLIILATDRTADPLSSVVIPLLTVQPQVSKKWFLASDTLKTCAKYCKTWPTDGLQQYNRLLTYDSTKPMLVLISSFLDQRWCQP